MPFVLKRPISLSETVHLLLQACCIRGPLLSQHFGSKMGGNFSLCIQSFPSPPLVGCCRQHHLFQRITLRQSSPCHQALSMAGSYLTPSSPCVPRVLSCSLCLSIPSSPRHSSLGPADLCILGPAEHFPPFLSVLASTTKQNMPMAILLPSCQWMQDCPHLPYLRQFLRRACFFPASGSF